MHTLIIAAGSPSTILAVAGYCRAHGITARDIASGDTQIVFTQAFQVGVHPQFGVSPALEAVRALPENGKVCLIGLAVNNRDPGMTLNFVREIGRHRLIGVYDEHDAELWKELRAILGYSEDDERFVTPGKHVPYLSAASIIGYTFEGMPPLWVAAGDYADDRHLCVSDEAIAVATAVDNACKATITDNLFRVAIVRYLLGSDSEAAKRALAEAELRGNVLVVRQPVGREINHTQVMFAGYQYAPFVAVVGSKAGEAAACVVTVGRNTQHAQFGKTDLLMVLRGLGASGIPEKATVYEDRITDILDILNNL